MKRIARLVAGIAFGGMLAMLGLMATPAKAEAIKCFTGSASSVNEISCAGGGSDVCCYWYDDTFQGCTGGTCGHQLQQ